ncbi:MAG: class II fructose-bisphosphate aldolase [Candidatus Shapirobacteria bacterium]|jgi:fructose-bisphosphate aldolase class II
MNTLRQYFDQYKSNHLSLPAFNIDCFEIYQAVESAVSETNLPCIVQLSTGEDIFVRAERLLMLVKKARIEGLPIFLNMDHGKDISRLKRLLTLGFDMVHFDGSAFSYQENLEISKNFISEIRHSNPDSLIEVEFNKINLIENGFSAESFTKPLQASEFMSATGADLLAVSIGNLHGVNTTYPENIDLDLLSQIAASIPENFLTLHGGSGISPEQIDRAIQTGIVKININTDLRLKYLSSLRHSLSAINSEKIYEYLAPAIDEVKEIVKQRIVQLSLSHS